MSDMRKRKEQKQSKKVVKAKVAKPTKGQDGGVGAAEPEGRSVGDGRLMFVQANGHKWTAADIEKAEAVLKASGRPITLDGACRVLEERAAADERNLVEGRWIWGNDKPSDLNSLITILERLRALHGGTTPVLLDGHGSITLAHYLDGTVHLQDYVY
jgi:hypothetical protein